MTSLSWALYGVGIAIMLVAMTSDRIDGWSSLAVWLGGLAVFVLGIVLEERGHRI